MKKTFIALVAAVMALAGIYFFFPEVLHDSIRTKNIVPPSSLNTVADDSAGGIEANSVTFTIYKNLTSELELLEEEEIKKQLLL